MQFLVDFVADAAMDRCQWVSTRSRSYCRIFGASKSYQHQAERGSLPPVAHVERSYFHTMRLEVARH
jgi:hypothetical protein